VKRNRRVFKANGVGVHTVRPNMGVFIERQVLHELIEGNHGRGRDIEMVEELYPFCGSTRTKDFAKGSVDEFHIVETAFDGGEAFVDNEFGVAGFAEEIPPVAIRVGEYANPTVEVCDWRRALLDTRLGPRMVRWRHRQCVLGA
jgi:hypothetical protein